MSTNDDMAAATTTINQAISDTTQTNCRKCGRALNDSPSRTKDSQPDNRRCPRTTHGPEGANRMSTRTRMTIAEVCADLGISRSTFYEWRAKGRAPRCIKLPNGDIRINRAEYERWLASLEDAA